MTGDYTPPVYRYHHRTVSLEGLRMPCPCLHILGNACKKTLDCILLHQFYRTKKPNDTPSLSLMHLSCPPAWRSLWLVLFVLIHVVVGIAHCMFNYGAARAVSTD